MMHFSNTGLFIAAIVAILAGPLIWGMTGESSWAAVGVLVAVILFFADVIVTISNRRR